MRYTRFLLAPRSLVVLVVIGSSFSMSALGGAALPGDTADTGAGGDVARGYRFRRPERCLMRMINHRRAAQGLRRLDRDRQLAYVARRHARTMAADGSVWHDPNLGRKVTRWRRLGDNVGWHYGCRRLFRAFMRSSGHRATTLAQWTFMGVGAVRRNGRLYAMELFEYRRNPGNVYGYP